MTHWLDDRLHREGYTETSPVRPQDVDACGSNAPSTTSSHSVDDQRYKRDAGKPRWTLIPTRALRVALDVFQFGAEKYAARSWRTVPDARERYAESLLRHAMAVSEAVEEHGAKGLHVRDEESGRPHLAHLAATALILIDLTLEGP